MSRSLLIHDIQSLDASINARQQRLAGARRLAGDRLRGVHPAWWLGSGVVLGFLSGRRGARSSLRLARTGLSLVSLVRVGLGVGASEL